LCPVVILHTYPAMKMEQTECSETSAYKIQMPGNYPEESIQHSEHGESLKSRIFSSCSQIGCWIKIKLRFRYFIFKQFYWHHESSSTDAMRAVLLTPWEQFYWCHESSSADAMTAVLLTPWEQFYWRHESSSTDAMRAVLLTPWEQLHQQKGWQWCLACPVYHCLLPSSLLWPIQPSQTICR